MVYLNRKARLPFVRASGSYYDMGLEVWHQCKHIAKSMLEKAEAGMSWKGISRDQATARARDCLPYAEEFDPKYIKFLEGYAKGSGVPFGDIFVLLCQDEKGLCTDVSVNGDATSDGSVLSAHTEDWIPSDEAHLVLLNAMPEGEPSFLVMSLGGFELVSGLNSAGICFSGNSLEQNELRVGIPKMCVARRIITSRAIVRPYPLQFRLTGVLATTTSVIRAGRCAVSRHRRRISPFCIPKMGISFTQTTIWIPGRQGTRRSSRGVEDIPLRTSRALWCDTTGLCGWLRRSFGISTPSISSGFFRTTQIAHPRYAGTRSLESFLSLSTRPSTRQSST